MSKEKVAGANLGPDWPGKRCTARSKRSGEPCRNPAVIGWTVAVCKALVVADLNAQRLTGARQPTYSTTLTQTGSNRLNLGLLPYR